MRYSVEKVCNKFKNGENLEFIFFWGHTKNKSNKITKACFSQWYLSDFQVNGVLYNCAEQYMMAEKARLFKDYERLEEILSATEQARIKALGRKLNTLMKRIGIEKNIILLRVGI